MRAMAIRFAAPDDVTVEGSVRDHARVPLEGEGTAD
jgi:hypothetical protein